MVVDQYLLMNANLQHPWSRAILMLVSDYLPIFRGCVSIESFDPTYLDLPGDRNGKYNVLCGRREWQNTL